MLIIFIVGTHRAKVAAPGAAATAPIPALAEVPAAVLVHRNAAWHRQGAAFLEDESELLAPPATAIVTAHNTFTYTCIAIHSQHFYGQYTRQHIRTTSCSQHTPTPESTTR